MGERDRRRHEYERGLARDGQQQSGEAPSEADTPDASSAQPQRAAHQARWVELQVEQAMRRGDFDDLPGAGKPIPGIDGPHDPDWWLKRLVQREQISVLPPALALRTEDTRLDATLDQEATPDGVRRVLEDFNARIVAARRQLQGGPPVITPLRDLDAELSAWSSRRTARAAAQTARLAATRAEEATSAPLPWWRRLAARLTSRRPRRPA